MMGGYLAGIQQFLILIWYFLTDRPAVEVMEEQLSPMPETQAQRIRRRWERSKQRAGRKG